MYNGENYIGEALDSVLGQTFEDFELIISDNASTDRTEGICRKYAAKDPRIRYFRNDINIGAAQNFNRVFTLSSGEYFKWAAHDDILAPEFLSKCVMVLDDDPSVVLCYSKIVKIDEYGKHDGTYNDDNEIRVDSFKPHERFRELMEMHHWTISVFGVIRANVLNRTPLIGNYVGSDRCLVAELGLIGRIYRVPEYLFFRREHPDSSCHKIKVPQERLGWFDPNKAGKICFPNWRYGLEYFKSVRRVSLSWSELIFCYMHIANWYRKRWIWLYRDLRIAARQTLKRSRLGQTLERWLFMDLKETARQILYSSRLGRKILEVRRQILRRV